MGLAALDLSNLHLGFLVTGLINIPVVSHIEGHVVSHKEGIQTHGGWWWLWGGGVWGGG